MNKFLAGMFVFLVAVFVSVLVMIYGWGLEPKSWWWIIGGWVGIRLLIDTIDAIRKL